MTLFTSEKQNVLENHPGLPFLVQEYINHNAVVIKVHVIGDVVSLNIRESWKNVTKEGMLFLNAVIISNYRKKN